MNRGLPSRGKFSTGYTSQLTVGGEIDTKKARSMRTGFFNDMIFKLLSLFSFSFHLVVSYNNYLYTAV